MLWAEVMRGFDAEHFILSADGMFMRMGKYLVGREGAIFFVTRITANFHELFILSA